MGALLIDQWLGTDDRIEIVDDASISELRDQIRAIGSSCGLASESIERLAAAASELGHNQLAHAGGGASVVRVISRGGIQGVEVIAADQGRGIADPAGALAGTPRSTGSLGVGLSAAIRQSDELDLDVREGAGTCVRIRAFATAVARSEIGILARPCPGETVIGDHAVTIRTADALVIAVADGLGHGPDARDAAERAIGVVATHPERALDGLLAEAHAATVGTRGAVMAIARIAGTTVEHAGVGNIGTRMLGIDGTVRAFGSAAGTLGSAVPRRIMVERVTRAPGDLVVMFSDGLVTRLDLSAEPTVVRRHPAAVAHYLHLQFARGTDDALIAVVR